MWLLSLCNCQQRNTTQDQHVKHKKVQVISKESGGRNGVEEVKEKTTPSTEAV